MKRTKRQLNAISRSYANKMKQKYYDFIKDNAIDEKVLGLDKIKYIENKKKVLRKNAKRQSKSLPRNCATWAFATAFS